MSNTAKISKPPPAPAPAVDLHQCLERAKSGPAAAPRPEANSAGLDLMPPALPPKTRKPKVSEAPKVSEHSDWGDSDMDEETYSSQEKLMVKKVRLYEFDGIFLTTSDILASSLRVFKVFAR